MTWFLEADLEQLAEGVTVSLRNCAFSECTK